MNAREELIDTLSGLSPIKCAFIEFGLSYLNRQVFILKIDYSQTDLDTFFESLNFVYDDGYGGQELFGTV